MAHKRVDPQVLVKIDQAIQNHHEAIRSAAVYREDRDRDSIKLLLKNVRSMLELTREKKDNSLLIPNDEGANFARYLLGRQKTYEELILSFEDAESFEELHKKEIERLELERAEYASYPVAE